MSVKRIKKLFVFRGLISLHVTDQDFKLVLPK